jgi:hypothetical protein
MEQIGIDYLHRLNTDATLARIVDKVLGKVYCDAAMPGN